MIAVRRCMAEPSTKKTTSASATLAASASYIAVPATMRIAVPQANPGLSLSAVLGVTFPFNIMLGIPLYHSWARHFME